MFSDLLYSKEGKKWHEVLKNQKALAIKALIIGIFFRLYTFKAESVFNLFGTQHKINHERFYHIISAGLLMHAILHFQSLQKMVLTKLGEYSFSIYLIHIHVLFFLGGYLFLEFFNRGSDIFTCIFFGSVISLLATAPAVFLLHHFIDMPAGKLAKRVQKFFE